MDKLDLQPNLAKYEWPDSNIKLARAEHPAAAITRMMDAAVAKGLSPGDLEKFIELHERVSDRFAEQQFNEAFARFHSERPKIVRRCENPQFKITRNGVRVNSKYASKEDIMHACLPTLTACGLTVSWGSPALSEGFVAIPCIVAHVGGHKRPTAYPFPTTTDARNTAPSPAQMWASTMSYAERYSLKAALGLTDVDDDDTDGNIPAGTDEPITEAQARDLNDLILETNANREAFLRFYSTRSHTTLKALADLPASQYLHAVQQLESKKRA